LVRDRRPAIKIGTGNPLKKKPSVHPALRDGSPPKKINNTKVPPSLPPPWTQGREGPASAGGWGPAPSDDISGTVVRALRAGYLSAARERGADPRITVRAETGGGAERRDRWSSAGGFRRFRASKTS